MNKTVTIVDYDNNRYDVEIKNFEDVDSIKCSIITGDEILEITYKDEKTIEIDADYFGGKCRLYNFFDDLYPIPLDMLDFFSSIQGGSYDRATEFRKELKRRMQCE